MIEVRFDFIGINEFASVVGCYRFDVDDKLFTNEVFERLDDCALTDFASELDFVFARASVDEYEKSTDSI